MPVKINQLIIRTTVVDDGEPGKTESSPTSSKEKKSAHQKIVAECVEQVMEILREQTEK